MKEQRNVLLLTAVVGLSGTLFVIDLLLPLGMSVWLPYILVVLLSLWFPQPWQTKLTAAGCSGLTILDLLYSSPGAAPFWHSALNRTLGILDFWAVAYLGLAARRSTQLQEANARLHQEIAARSRSEQRLREQASLLDLAQDAIMVRDLNDRILFWNKGAERTYGWSAAEAVGKNARELLFPERPHSRGLSPGASPPERDSTSVDETFPIAYSRSQRTLLEQGECSGEWRHTTRNGREIVVASRCTLVRDDKGRPQFKLVVNTDVTEKKKLEAQFLRTQRLESVGILAGGIAHDFNNLLTPILMAAKLLKENRPDEERRRLLTTLQASAERGAELVRQLLSFAGGTESQPKLLQIAQVVQEVKSILDHSFPSSLQIAIHVSDNLHPVYADATQIAQVLMNLCVNARDAMLEGGTLTIAADNVLVDPQRCRNRSRGRSCPHVRIMIADTGTGIPAETIDHIFDPFFTTKEPGEGTGLGLSTVLGIVQNHDGFIDVTSEVGQGSRFSVCLPALPAAAPQPKALPAEPLDGQGELLLVVDDEVPILQTAQAILESRGYRVLTAVDGKESLARYQQQQSEIRAVILDLAMPGLDGAATLAALRQLEPQVRVLTSSGLQPRGPVAKLILAGEVSFLQKPYSEAQLLAALQRLLQRGERKVPSLEAVVDG